MSNPFIEPGSLVSELERRRRERFKVGVYAVLGTAAIFLAGMLIQGCKHQQQALFESAPQSPAEETTNAAAKPTNATTPANPIPDTNAAAAQAVAPVPTLPTVEPPAVADPPPPSISIPAAISAPSPGETSYVVKRGDSLSRIARTHGTTVKALQAANGLKNDQLAVGRKLKLPKAHSTSAASAGI